MAVRRITLSKPNYTAPVVDGSADLSGAKGTVKVEHKNTQYSTWYNTWNDETDAYTFTYDLVYSNEAGTSTPIVLGPSANNNVIGYQASSDTWRGTLAEFIITATNPIFPDNDLAVHFNIVVTDPYYEGAASGSARTPPPSTPPPSGCTDPGAFNYDPSAVVDDGSCIYPESDEGRTGDGPAETSQVEYTTDIRTLTDILPSTPLIYNGDDLIITLDLRLITYKPSALAEIMDREFKSY